MTAQPPASGETLNRLAREEIPFLFDSVALQPDGSLVHTARQSLNFSFDYQGVTFATICQRIDGRSVVNVAADLGPVPFSAESVRARREIQELVIAGGSDTVAQLTITDDQTIRIVSTFELAQPISPVVMLTAVTELMLALKPTLLRLGEILSAATPRVHGTA